MENLLVESGPLSAQGETIRAALEERGRLRYLAMLNLAIDSKLRASDLMRLKIEDVSIGGGYTPKRESSMSIHHSGERHWARRSRVDRALV
jgi:hypothetical protein